MGLFNWLGGFINCGETIGASDDAFVNSASGAYYFSSPSINIDGSPMMDGIDIHGHPFGVTDDMLGSGSSGCNGMFSSDMGSSCFTDPFD